MKRLKVLFAAVLLLLFLPLWRYADMVPMFIPFRLPFTFVNSFVFGIFLAIPLKLMFSRIKTPILVSLTVLIAGLSWWTSPLSKMATTGPEFNHCGVMSFTGFTYPARNLLTDAYRDDLEARNQICWLRKMISRVPRKFDSEDEVTNYSKLTQDKLLRPEIKFRSTLPLVAYLYYIINSSYGDNLGIKRIYESLHFWKEQYTYEISTREYSPWNWPHSSYIKFEYGLVESNWQKIVDNMMISEN